MKSKEQIIIENFHELEQLRLQLGFPAKMKLIVCSEVATKLKPDKCSMNLYITHNNKLI